MTSNAPRTYFMARQFRMWVFREFTRLVSILKKAPFHLDHPLYFFGLSMGRRKACGWDLRRFPYLVSRGFSQETYAEKSEAELFSKHEASTL